MTNNDHDLYTAGLPVSFASTKVAKKIWKQKKSKKQQKAAQKRCTSEMENVVEEFGVLEVLARYRSSFTILMDPEERLARTDEDEISYEMPLELDYDLDDAEEVTKQTFLADEDEEVASDGKVVTLVESIEDAPAVLHKYYQQRYDYFSRFDEGIQIDHEGWYSVTPEAIAAHTANELFAIAHKEGKESVVLDVFCGVGGNSIHFAQVFDRVIAVDLSPTRLEMARHNAEIYGVADKIEFVCADAFEFLELKAQSLQISAVFLSPPWGGPEYCMKPVFHPQNDLFNGRGLELFQLARSITRNRVFFMPRQTDLYAFAQMIQTCTSEDKEQESESFVVEQHYLKRRLKAISIYLY